MARILAPILAYILILIGWKKSVVFANLTAAQSWKGWNGCPPDPNRFYPKLIHAISLELLQFIFGFQKIQVQMSPETERILQTMKRGGLMLTAHFGNWEVLGSFLRKKEIPLVATFQPFPHSLSNRILAWFRYRNGNKVERLEDSPFSIRHHFRSGNLFTFLADQDYRDPYSSKVPSYKFLDLSVNCNPLPQRLCDLFPNSSLFFASAIPIAHHQYEVLAKLICTEDSSCSIMDLYNEWLESEISQNPQLWSGWTHRRFLSTKPTVYSQSAESPH